MENTGMITELFSILGLFVSGGILSFVAGRFSKTVGTEIAHGLSLIGSLWMALFSFGVLYRGEGISFSLPGQVSFFEFSFRIDGLSAFFLLVISTVTALASLYGFGYFKKTASHFRTELFGFSYPIFIASLFLVSMANNGLFFLFAWELMSIASYFLVISDRSNENGIRAGFQYLLMTHFGTVFVALAFFLAFGATGSFDFEMWRASYGTVSETVLNLIYLFAIIGFGTKAGIIPLHIWLPEAHPAAPSHVSAILSGAMIKTAIFMIIRVFFDFFPGARMEWGLFLLVIAGGTALLGILYALSDVDIKRFLAYSSIENVGIILLGVGSAIVAVGYGKEQLAFFGLAAALYHTMNHAIFKSLLFLGAGSVVASTETRNMESYGGLLKVLPWTGFFFLVGSMAISALPPLNGFASEWFTFQSLFIGIASPSILVKGVFLFAIGALAFTSGLAAACFVKAFGVTFLAKPRTQNAKEAKEASFSMLLPMGMLATLAVLLGVFSTTVIAGILGVVGSIAPASSEPLRFVFWELIENRAMFSTVLPLEWVTIGLLMILAIVSVPVYFFTRKRNIVVSRTWDCGAPIDASMEITATGFSRSLVTIFRGLLRPTKQVDVEYHDERMRYFVKSQSVETSLFDVYRGYLYRPFQKFLEWMGERAKRIQTGNINTYLLYIFLTVLLLLLFAAR